MLVNTKNMLLDAKRNRYAVPAFNIHNLETFKVVVETASKLKSPVIVAATPGTFRYSGRDYIQAIAEVAANKYNIPIALHLDHHQKYENIKKSIDLGTKSVMIDASFNSFLKNIKKVQQVVKYAKPRDVTVEAELGSLAGQEDDMFIDEKKSKYTDPNQAIDFVKKTKIDSLAIAIGTAHGMYKEKPDLDFGRLAEIRENISIPLVLHGASGLSESDVKKCIELGINKVNIATELKISFANAVKKYFRNNPGANDPRKYLENGKEAMAVVVENKIKMCNSNNRCSTH